jgi:hypothetical protein
MPVNSLHSVFQVASISLPTLETDRALAVHGTDVAREARWHSDAQRQDDLNTQSIARPRGSKLTHAHTIHLHT